MLNKLNIEFPSDYKDTLKIVLDSVALSFLAHFLPELSADSLQRIAESSSLTLFGIYPGLESCFIHESMLDQFKHSYLASPAFLDFWRKSFPGIENLKAVPIESYDMFKSPWAPNIENEEFVEENIDLVRGDQFYWSFLSFSFTAFSFSSLFPDPFFVIVSSTFFFLLELILILQPWCCAFILLMVLDELSLHI